MARCLIYLAIVFGDIFSPLDDSNCPCYIWASKTALPEVQDGTLVQLDSRHGVLLVLLDLSSAFDSVDH